MKKYSSIALVLIALLLVGAMCSKKNTNSNTNNDDGYGSVFGNENTNTDVENENSNQNVNTGIKANVNVELEDDTNDNLNTNSNSNTGSADDPQETVSGGAISITKPTKNATVTSPFTVEGQTMSKQVFVRVKGSGGKTLFTVPVTVRNELYKATLTIDVVNSTSGVIEVFDKDSAGEENNISSVSVTFVRAETTTNANTSTTNTNSSTNTSVGY